MDAGDNQQSANEPPLGNNSVFSAPELLPPFDSAEGFEEAERQQKQSSPPLSTSSETTSTTTQQIDDLLRCSAAAFAAEEHDNHAHESVTISKTTATIKSILSAQMPTVEEDEYAPGADDDDAPKMAMDEKTSAKSSTGSSALAPSPFTDEGIGAEETAAAVAAQMLKKSISAALVVSGASVVPVVCAGAMPIQAHPSSASLSSATSASSCYSSGSYATSSFSSSRLSLCNGLDDCCLDEALTMRCPAAAATNEYADVDLGDLSTVATLGVGGFGRVNLVKHNDTDKLFAMKILNKAHITELNQKEHVLSERSVQMDCRCDFIVRLYRTYRDPERLYMLMEYCAGGEVWTALRNWGHFDEGTARFYAAAALEAFDYLHRRLIVYRDLKPENMLLDAQGIPKLADFGFAKRLGGPSDRAWTFCGTAEYVAPEVITNKGQDWAVDLWSLGIFLYELISGQPPFASPEPMNTYSAILKGVQNLSWPRYITDQAKLLICRLCRRNPSERIGYACIDEVRRDPLYRGFDFVAFRAHTMRPPIRPKLRGPTDTHNFDRYPATDSFALGIDESGWDEQF